MKTQFKTSKNTSNIFIFNIFFLLLTSGNAFGQINLNEMNGIHLDFTIKQTKKKIGQKLKLEKTKDGFGGYNLQASVVYKGVAYQLIFGSLEDENDLKSYNLNEISTRSDKAKTDLGIRIGSTLKEVQNAYKIYENKNQYFSIDQGPETLDPEDTTVEYYQIYDSESGHLMRFSFTDNRVSEIEIASVDSL
jgi:hypothetical protein